MPSNKTEGAHINERPLSLKANNLLTRYFNAFQLPK